MELYAGLYRTMAAVPPHMSPREVDELELWEIATLLGGGTDAAQADIEVNGRLAAPRLHDRRAHLRARLRAHKEGKPAPTWAPTDPTTVDSITSALSGA